MKQKSCHRSVWGWEAVPTKKTTLDRCTLTSSTWMTRHKVCQVLHMCGYINNHTQNSAFLQNQLFIWRIFQVIYMICIATVTVVCFCLIELCDFTDGESLEVKQVIQLDRDTVLIALKSKKCLFSLSHLKPFVCMFNRGVWYWPNIICLYFWDFFNNDN